MFHTQRFNVIRVINIMAWLCCKCSLASLVKIVFKSLAAQKQHCKVVLFYRGCRVFLLWKVTAGAPTCCASPVRWCSLSPVWTSWSKLQQNKAQRDGARTSPRSHSLTRPRMWGNNLVVAVIIRWVNRLQNIQIKWASVSVMPHAHW